jgi:hypothetical protein
VVKLTKQVLSPSPSTREKTTDWKVRDPLIPAVLFVSNLPDSEILRISSSMNESQAKFVPMTLYDHVTYLDRLINTLLSASPPVQVNVKNLTEATLRTAVEKWNSGKKWSGSYPDHHRIGFYQLVVVFGGKRDPKTKSNRAIDTLKASSELAKAADGEGTSSGLELLTLNQFNSIIAQYSSYKGLKTDSARQQYTNHHGWTDDWFADLLVRAVYLLQTSSTKSRKIGASELKWLDSNDRDFPKTHSPMFFSAVSAASVLNTVLAAAAQQRTISGQRQDELRARVSR